MIRLTTHSAYNPLTHRPIVGLVYCAVIVPPCPSHAVSISATGDSATEAIDRLRRWLRTTNDAGVPFAVLDA